MKPTPLAILVAHSMFELGSLIIAQTCKFVEMGKKVLPAFRRHYGADELELCSRGSRFVAKRSRDASIHIDFPLLADVYDVNQAWRDIDDVLDESFAVAQGLLGQ